MPKKFKMYGDPGLLFPILFPELKRIEPVYDFLLIPHYYEYQYFRDRMKGYKKKFSHLNFKLIDVLSGDHF